MPAAPMVTVCDDPMLATLAIFLQHNRRRRRRRPPHRRRSGWVAPPPATAAADAFDDGINQIGIAGIGAGSDKPLHPGDAAAADTRTDAAAIESVLAASL